MIQSKRRMLAMVAFLGALACILAIGLVSYEQMSSLTDSSNRIRRSRDVLQTIDDLNAALTDSETNQRGYLLTQDASYLTQYEAAIAQIRLALAELHRLGDEEPDTQAAITNLAKLVGDKLTELQQSIRATKGGKPQKALAIVLASKNRSLMESFAHDSAVLEGEQRRLLELRRQQEERARFFSKLVLASTIVLSLLLLFAAALISRRFDERRTQLEDEIAVRRRAEEYRESLLVSERAARSEAERATRLKDDFVATLSHELRTPLNAIVGWASILRRDQRNETITQGVEVIERNAKAQAQMIEELLDMSRIISGKLHFDLHKTDLVAVIEAAIAAVRPSADARGITLAARIVSPGSVNGDFARLQQIVLNLLTNAIKFTPRGGRVEVLLQDTGDNARIAVSDTGQGIKAEFLPFVFDRFRQADASTTRRHGGLGLGLSIVKSLAEMHGGSVDVESLGEGLGTTFIVHLPLAQPHVPGEENNSDTAQPIKPHTGPALTGLRILVVDDEADARTLARRVLEECGANVLTAGSAAEAMAAVDAGALLSVIVSDIGMPDQDGYDLIRQMRLLPGAAGQVPAVALTALARGEDRNRALLAGYQRHVTKPVDPAELVAVIANLAGRTRQVSAQP
jgi:signal transduction histidine kinase/ActR/RegA family two-component response regulator